MASTSDAVLPNDPKAIAEFCSVTGCDEEKAKKMLDICNWNLEMAVNMHVDSDFLESTGIEPPVNGIDPEGVRAPIPQSRAVLVEDSSIHYGLRGRKRIAHSVFDGLRDFRAEAELQEQSVNDIKKRRTLEDLFRPPLV